MESVQHTTTKRLKVCVQIDPILHGVSGLGQAFNDSLETNEDLRRVVEVFLKKTKLKDVDTAVKKFCKVSFNIVGFENLSLFSLSMQFLDSQIVSASLGQSKSASKSRGDDSLSFCSAQKRNLFPRGSEIL